ncbi:MAG: class I SAM-dependent methyltransferase, partial [Anaerolineae bacterium]|nr:class I SAM-dependent methyltransferase [Anaerolineae bacterium]
QHQGVSISFHRPLEEYVNALAACGLLIDCLREITTHRQEGNRAERRANEEIPLFLALRAWKLDRPD